MYLNNVNLLLVELFCDILFFISFSCCFTIIGRIYLANAPLIRKMYFGRTSLLESMFQYGARSLNLSKGFFYSLNFTFNDYKAYASVFFLFWSIFIAVAIGLKNLTEKSNFLVLKVTSLNLDPKLIDFTVLLRYQDYLAENLNSFYFFSKEYSTQINNVAMESLINVWTPSFLLDRVTCIMLFVVLSISFLVHLYSTEYMAGDLEKYKFMTLLSFFTFCMLVLISANNLIQLFFGWEGVGLCSYLLISFWNKRIAAVKAANKAVLLNRVGDCGLLLAIGFCLQQYQTVDFSDLAAQLLVVNKDINIFTINMLGMEVDLLKCICFFLFVGAVGKSAQIGLHPWLADAMEGPTPVSALIHAATMVTAGIFLIIRLNILFEQVPDILYLMSIFGGLTCLFAGTCGIAQHDIKKIIAFSTCSQLGYMLGCCGLGAYTVSLFHLFTHAYFKALLFLTAGAIIHSIGGEQDLRKMGQFRQFLPELAACIFIGSIALMGIPPFSGFHSKDTILELALISENGLPLYILGLLSCITTTIYSLRLYLLGFHSRPNSTHSIYQQIGKSSLEIITPLYILVFASLCFGFIFKSLFVDPSIGAMEFEFINVWKELPLLLVLITTILCISLYFFKTFIMKALKRLFLLIVIISLLNFYGINLSTLVTMYTFFKVYWITFLLISLALTLVAYSFHIVKENSSVYYAIGNIVNTLLRLLLVRLETNLKSAFFSSLAWIQRNFAMIRFFIFGIDLVVYFLMVSIDKTAKIMDQTALSLQETNVILFKFLNNKWYFDKFYVRGIIPVAMYISLKICTEIWHAMLSFIELRVGATTVTMLSQQIKLLQSGKITEYLRFTFICLIVFIAFIDLIIAAYWTSI